ncbi:MAG: C25 family peptidase propeptide domain-containing protein [Bacteroidales bacterium]
MKQLSGLIILLSFILLNHGYADSFTQSYNFEKPQIIHGNDRYTDISVKNCYLLANEGDPLLPLFAADLLLSQGHGIIRVEIESVNIAGEINNLKIRPASKQFPISLGLQTTYNVIPNELIYNSPGPYPNDPVGSINTGFLAGHSIGSFSICPVIYYPSLDKIEYIEQITLKIVTGSTTKAQNASNFIKPSNRISERINSIVDNTEMLDNYIYPKSKSATVDILLISKNSLIPHFSDYIEYKKSVGFLVETKAVEDIYLEYAGQDEPEK